MENSICSKKTNFNSSNRSGSISERKILQHTGSLEIVDGNGQQPPQAPDVSKSSSHRPPSQGNDRSWSRSSMGSIPPRNDSSLSRRTPTTPTKQVSLQGVRRKTECGEPFVDHVDWREFSQDKSHMTGSGSGSLHNGGSLSRGLEPQIPDEDACDPDEVAALNEEMKRLRLQREFQKDPEPVRNEQKERAEGGGAGPVILSDKEKLRRDEKEKEEVEDEDSSSSDDDDDDEPRKAPNELLMEFIDCIIKKDFKNADKLCKMILIYEPNNAEALSFKPVIEEKMQLDEEAANEESDDDSDDDDDDDDDSEDDDDDSEDDTSSEEEEEEEDNQPGPSSASHHSNNNNNSNSNNAKKSFPYFNSENYQSGP